MFYTEVRTTDLTFTNTKNKPYIFQLLKGSQKQFQRAEQVDNLVGNNTFTALAQLFHRMLWKKFRIARQT